MQNLGWKTRLQRLLLDIDARLDFGLFQGGSWSRELFERFSDFMDRFHVAGWRRWFLIEPLSEAATLGCVGMIGMLTLAIPAFQETSDEDWLRRSEIAVTFLDRYGNEVGSRGVKQNEFDSRSRKCPITFLRPFSPPRIAASTSTSESMFRAPPAPSSPTRAPAACARADHRSPSSSPRTCFSATSERSSARSRKPSWRCGSKSRLTKNEILKLYLDRAYMGGGTFGVNAAAQYYFGKSARDVNLSEAAMLAGLFKAPSKFSPANNLPAARARANTVLDNLVESGFMSEGQVFGARRNPATPIDRRDEGAPNYYLDAAFNEMTKLAEKLPKSITERSFTVRTALDVNVQHAAENAIENMLKQYGREYNAHQAALVLADLDGGVRAIVGGRDYGASQFNRATDAMRQPGSSFKPYVYSTALANGFTPNTIVVDGPICLGNWCPHNYGGGFAGRVTLTQAITRSLNTVAVRLSVEIGKKTGEANAAKAGRAMIVDTARRMGITTPLPDTPSLPIGADAVTIFEHAVAYATFPNKGIAVTPHTILEVRAASGETIWRFDRDGPKPRRALTEQVAVDMVGMMNHVVEEGTARRAMLNGIKAAGKTGTTNNYRDAWFVGYTGNFVCGVWYGNDDYAPLNRMTGGALPAMTWHEVMAYAHQGVELKNLPGLPPRSVNHRTARSRLASGPESWRYIAASGAPHPARHAGADADRACDGRCSALPSGARPGGGCGTRAQCRPASLRCNRC